jgi:hypothetical protein
VIASGCRHPHISNTANMTPARLTRLMTKSISISPVPARSLFFHRFFSSDVRRSVYGNSASQARQTTPQIWRASCRATNNERLQHYLSATIIPNTKKVARSSPGLSRLAKLGTLLSRHNYASAVKRSGRRCLVASKFRSVVSVSTH